MRIKLLKLFCPKKALKIETGLLVTKESGISQEIQDLREIAKKEKLYAKFYSNLAAEKNLDVRNVYKASTSLTSELYNRLLISDFKCQQANLNHMIKVNETKLEKLESK